MKNACTFTGPKPTRFKFKYNEDYKLCKKIKKSMLTQMKRLYNEKGVRRFYITGAIGVHMWAGELALQLKSQPGYSASQTNYIRANSHLVDHAQFLIAVSEHAGDLASDMTKMESYAAQKNLGMIFIHPDTAETKGVFSEDT